jgi:short-subunit dehydrogenase involved in D-alanine esterification of teichoic acids
MNILIIGGTSGLGLELGKCFSGSNKVIVTGRHDPKLAKLEYKEFDLAAGDLPKRTNDLRNCLI